MECHVKTTPEPPRILLVGLGVRLIYSVLVLMVLWALFFWATFTPGML